MAYVPFERSFPPLLAAPSLARRATATWLGDRGVPPATVDDVLIVVSELVANGVLHGGDADITLRIDIDGDDVSVEVCTAPATPGGPQASRTEPTETGRGLTMVAACCEAVDVLREPSGRRRASCRISMRGSRAGAAGPSWSNGVNA
jgi:anti-sigma regulatory factor (Ser/Thr protein kinase)